MREVVLYRQPGRFAGWPANYGLWNFGEQLVAIVAVGWVTPRARLHAIDPHRPPEPHQLTSTDGGVSWSDEMFPGDLRGIRWLSVDEHLSDDLRAGPGMYDRLPRISPPGIDFHAERVLAARTGVAVGAESWFYRSAAPGRWDGPYLLPSFGRSGVAARTDVVPLGRHEALWLLTSTRAGDHEGGTICAYTTDGGQSFTLRSVVCEEDSDGYAIMPSSVRLSDGSIVTIIRRPSRLEVWRSTDSGFRWSLLCPVLADTGRYGNPASLVATVDGVLVAIYGRRREPFGIFARHSDDGGATWSPESMMVGGIATADFGYPRTVGLDDGSFLTIYYRADSAFGDRWIAGLLWNQHDLASPTVGVE